MINFINNKRIDSAFANAKRNKKFLRFEAIKKVLLIFNLADWQDVEKVIDSLRKEGKTVTAWTTCTKATANQFPMPKDVRVVNLSKDLTWSKALKKEIADEFMNLQYETLLDLTTSSEPILNYFLAMNTSDFCIGIRQSERQCYDFVILKNEDASIVETYTQIKHYLGNIG